ncbi:L-histidine N(alpha)-methyltransferase [Nostoc sp. UHCC 0870]|uniref:L-histidine N(alpha)-methyltransferase n=1 Tax=Nostoc sp. UHCC 0870 TaxID=2914041 RepID=UPI001EDCB596|nr:L-histidine N(alpha)-methyltransferase [Nostoc sp. UHCC 0870]UKO98618.1 L-histidine N(alpha)-methyltransferase [Nostoc sp. UHCC 0870]
MAKNSSDISTAISFTAKPIFEFYSLFSEAEILEIIYALEVRQEIPLKYSYKGRGAKIWDDFYLKYIIPKWYRTSNVEIDLLKDNFAYINSNSRSSEKINVIDVGSGNSYPVKNFISRLNKLNRINKYVALDVSDELLKVSRKNFQKWFPLIEFVSQAIDIENNCISPDLMNDKTEIYTTANVILHLGVTIGNHQNRIKVFKNFKASMGKNDFLVFTNEIGSNSTWDEKARGGCGYHAREIYEWIKNNLGIRDEDCELIRKYDLAIDSVVANMKFCHNYTINFNYQGIDKNVTFSKGEEITIWRHHKHEIPELLQEIEQAGLQLSHYTTNKYSSHIMAICQVAK